MNQLDKLLIQKVGIRFLPRELLKKDLLISTRQSQEIKVLRSTNNYNKMARIKKKGKAYITIDSKLFSLT